MIDFMIQYKHVYTVKEILHEKLCLFHAMNSDMFSN